jgi:transposase-like protein
MLKDILNHSQIASLIADEGLAREFIEMLRWPGGPVCPHCGATNVYRIAPNIAKKVRKGLYRCGDCGGQFTVTVGTIFEDSRIPLNKWFHAIHLLCSSKKSCSAHKIHRTLGITYKSAWFMMHRIRHAMAKEPLASQVTGIVESDETYIGGKAKNKYAKECTKNFKGRGTVNKEVVVTLVERGRVKTTHVGHVTGANLKVVLRANVTKAARIMTHENALFNGGRIERRPSDGQSQGWRVCTRRRTRQHI